MTNIRPPKMENVARVYKGSGVPVFKIPLISGGLLHMSQFVGRKQNVIGIYRRLKNYINLEYLPL